MACYMTFSSSMWIKAARKREVKLEGKSLKKFAEALKEIYVTVEFREDVVWLDRQLQLQLEREWKGLWQKLKHLMKGKSENCNLKKYKDKKMQSEGKANRGLL